MKTNYFKYNIQTVFFVILIILLYLGTLNSLQLKLGTLSIGLILFLTNSIFLIKLYYEQRLVRFQLLIIIIGFSYIIFAIITNFMNDKIGHYNNILQFIGCLGFLLYFSNIRWNYSKINASYIVTILFIACLLYTSPSPRDQRGSRMPSSA